MFDTEVLYLVPIVLLSAFFSLANYTRAKLAERRAAGWEEAAKSQEVAMDNLIDALKNQGEALDRIMLATKRYVAKDN